MKIAFVTDSVSRRAGGLFEANRRLAQALAALGEEVCVFGVADAQTEADRAAWAPVRLITAASKGPRRFGYAPDLERQLEAFDPDVVHTHGIWTYTSVVSSRWQRRTGRPVIIHPHGMLDPWAVRNAAWKKRVAGWLFEYRHLRNAAGIRALCESEADAIRAFGLKNPVAVIPNGMDLPDLVESCSLRVDGITSQHSTTISQPQCAERRTLLYLGRIHPKKGLVNLIGAWKATLDSRPSALDIWTLVIAGWEEGGHEAELKRLCDELGLLWSDARDGNPASVLRHPSSVRFLGPQFGEAKAACYRECDAFVLPSFSEGLPMVVLEAWAYGKPVLMTPECNLPEGFAAGAAIRIETNVESVAAGLRRLFQVPRSELLACGHNGRELVRTRFTWPKIAADLRDVYTWLLGMGAKPDCVR